MHGYYECECYYNLLLISALMKQLSTVKLISTLMKQLLTVDISIEAAIHCWYQHWWSSYPLFISALMKKLSTFDINIDEATIHCWYQHWWSSHPMLIWVWSQINDLKSQSGRACCFRRNRNSPLFLWISDRSISKILDFHLKTLNYGIIGHIMALKILDFDW